MMVCPPPLFHREVPAYQKEVRSALVHRDVASGEHHERTGLLQVDLSP